MAQVSNVECGFSWMSFLALQTRMLAPDVVTARTSLRAEARCRAGKVTDKKFEAALEAGLNHVNTCRQVNIVLPGLQADRLEQVRTGIICETRLETTALLVQLAELTELIN